jgi:1-deoxy-D-xylulose-5-phosphate reductoisomerase
LAYPNRLPSDYPRFNFLNYPSLTFEQPDYKTFRNLNLAFEAMKHGGNMPCILNAANEIAVAAFLRDQIGFLAMSDLIETCMQKVAYIEKPNYEQYVATDEETRRKASEILRTSQVLKS